MKLNVNKRIVRAGDTITVQWDEQEASNARLVLHSGQREMELAVPSSGEKQFRLKGQRGLQWIALKCYVGNSEKIIKHRMLVWGSHRRTDDFEYMDRQDTWMGRMQSGLKRWWNYYSPEKKRLYILLLLLLCYQFMATAWPQAASVLLYVIIFWLFWQVIKPS